MGALGIAPVLLPDVLDAMVLTTVGVLVANGAALVATRLLLVTRVLATEVAVTFARGKAVGTGARVGAPATAGLWAITCSGDEGDITASCKHGVCSMLSLCRSGCSSHGLAQQERQRDSTEYVPCYPFVALVGPVRESCNQF